MGIARRDISTLKALSFLSAKKTWSYMKGSMREPPVLLRSKCLRHLSSRPSFFLSSKGGDLSTEASWERKGLDMLLAHYSTANLIHLDRHDPNGAQEPGYFDYGGPPPGEPGGWIPAAPGPWVSITLAIGNRKKQFGIWKETGAVYEVDRYGACLDDPFLVPEGSSYDGPVNSQQLHAL